MEIINWKKYNTFQHRAGYNETCIDYILCSYNLS